MNEGQPVYEDALRLVIEFDKGTQAMRHRYEGDGFMPYTSLTNYLLVLLVDLASRQLAQAMAEKMKQQGQRIVLPDGSIPHIQ